MAKNLAFLAFLYFVQGMPYGLQTWFLPVFFRSRGMSLSNVGFFKFLLAPWMLKALWAPFVDNFGTKKTWLIWSMVGLALTCIIASFSGPTFLSQLAAILLLLNLLTSTQDIAVDGLAIQMLTTSELANGNSAQVVGYKLGAVVGGGLLTWLSDYLDWMVLFQCLALIYIFAVFIAYKYIPPTHQNIMDSEVVVSPSFSDNEIDDVAVDNKPEGLKEQGIVKWMVNHFKVLLNTEGTMWIAVYVIVYKLGEKGSLSMIPMFLLDQGVSASQVGFWTGLMGQAVSILGSLIGGVMMSSFGHSTFIVLKRLSIIRSCVLLIVCFIIFTWSPGQQSSYSILLIGLMLVMLMISGYITTATFTLMMECSQRAPPRVQASHYTTLATLEVLGKLSFSIAIGWLTDNTSYSTVFILFTVLSAAIIPIFNCAPPIVIQSSLRSNKNC